MLIVITTAITALVSTLFGYLALPRIIARIQKKRQFSASKVVSLVEQAAEVEKKKFLKSPEFKKRLADTQKMIQDEAAEGKRELKVSYFPSCKMDSMLFSVLEKRGFSCYEIGENTLRIRW